MARFATLTSSYGYWALAYFLLTYALTWLGWLAASALWGGPPSTGSLAATLGWGVFLLGVFSPGLVALGLTAHADGGPAARALLQPILRWRVPARWYAFALGYLAAIKLAAALLHRLVAGAWPPFGTLPWLLLLPAIAFSTWVQAGEEVGWRGYALPRLSERLGLRGGSILLGVLWAGWHLPLFLLPGTDTTGQSFPVYTSQVTALSVALAWLWWRTGRSLLPVMLMHSAVNNTQGLVPSPASGATDPLSIHASSVAWLTTLLLWIGAGCFLSRMPRREGGGARHTA